MTLLILLQWLAALLVFGTPALSTKVRRLDLSSFRLPPTALSTNGPAKPVSDHEGHRYVQEVLERYRQRLQGPGVHQLKTPQARNQSVLWHQVAVKGGHGARWYGIISSLYLALVTNRTPQDVWLTHRKGKGQLMLPWSELYNTSDLVEPLGAMTEQPECKKRYASYFAGPFTNQKGIADLMCSKFTALASQTDSTVCSDSTQWVGSIMNNNYVEDAEFKRRTWRYAGLFAQLRDFLFLPRPAIWSIVSGATRGQPFGVCIHFRQNVPLAKSAKDAVVRCAESVSRAGRVFVASYNQDQSSYLEEVFQNRLVVLSTQGTQYNLEQRQHYEAVATLLIFRDYCPASILLSPGSSFVNAPLAGANRSV